MLKPTIASRISEYEFLTSTINFDEFKCLNIDEIPHTKIGSGGYNNVYKINMSGVDLIVKIPKTEFASELYPNMYKYISCTNEQYLLALSNLTTNNVFPHFPYVLKTLLCDDDYNKYYPISIQEYCDIGDFYKLINTKNKNVVAKYYDKSLLQILISLYFMENTLKISHNDIKPENVLLKNIQNTVITYKINDENYIKIKSSILPIISDFDMLSGTDNIDFQKNIGVYNHYMSILLLAKYYYHYHTSSEEIYIDFIDGNRKKLNRELLSSSPSSFLNLFQIYSYDTPITTRIKNLYKEVVQKQNSFFKNVSQFILMSVKHKEITYELDFLEDLIINNLNFFDCVKKYFSSKNEDINFSDTYECEGMKYDVNINQKLTFKKLLLENYKQNKNIFACAIQNIKTRFSKSDIFISELYGLNRFQQSQTRVSIDDLNTYVSTHQNLYDACPSEHCDENISLIRYTFFHDIINNINIRNKFNIEDNRQLLNILKAIDFVLYRELKLNKLSVIDTLIYCYLIVMLYTPTTIETILQYLNKESSGDKIDIPILHTYLLKILDIYTLN